MHSNLTVIKMRKACSINIIQKEIRLAGETSSLHKSQLELFMQYKQQLIEDYISICNSRHIRTDFTEDGRVKEGLPPISQLHFLEEYCKDCSQSYIHIQFFPVKQ